MCFGSWMKIAGSGAARFPELFGEVRQALRAISIQRELTKRPNMTVEQAVHWIFSQADAEARRLENLADRYQTIDPELANWLRRLAGKMRANPGDREGLQGVLDGDEETTGRRLGALEVRQHTDHGEWVINRASSNLRGNVGEMLIALLLERPTAIGIMVRDLPGAEQRMAQYGLSGHDQQILMNKEIDIVFRGGAAWGEVKNTWYVDLKHLTERRSKDKKSIWEQARENADLAHIFGKEAHAFFLNGIHPDAAAKLATLGIVVHNVLSQPPANNH